MGQGAGIETPGEVHPVHGVERDNVVHLAGQGGPVVGITHIQVL